VLIPSIDLMGGRIVQLVQGERLAFATDDIDAWVDRFSTFSIVQLIDLDAAKNEGRNDALVRRICTSLPCQVGGGVRTIADAQARLDAGARKVIVGSALFDAGGVRSDKAAEFAGALTRERFIAAVDSRGGQIVVHGWKTTIGLAAVDAVRTLSEHAGGFLATLVDGEGLMGGVNMQAALQLRQATDRQLIVAGGIRNMDEVIALDAHGMDAVVGMALYGNPEAVPPVDNR
jgi:phosphoribosylformimino-5-aminoimidazole carboxamide ribotide isomerase